MLDLNERHVLIVDCGMEAQWGVPCCTQHSAFGAPQSGYPGGTFPS
jgi:hypothetical protein